MADIALCALVWLDLCMIAGAMFSYLDVSCVKVCRCQPRAWKSPASACSGVQVEAGPLVVPRDGNKV